MSTTLGCAWPRYLTHLESRAVRQLCGSKAADLFKRFNEAFWDEESGFYALTLDGNKRKVLTVASNPGHCLWSGIVPPARAGKVVKRLMAPDMWSGWGIRTLSALHPAFNPYNYQTGSVWPHDNAIIALGFKRYGFGVEAARIAGDISDAGSHFLHSQLPELYTTIQRDEASFPVQYLGANIPQAWAAGSVFALMQAMLGLRAGCTARKVATSIRGCRSGCPTSRCSTFVLENTSSISGSGVTGRKRNSRCCVAIQRPSCVAALVLKSHPANLHHPLNVAPPRRHIDVYRDAGYGLPQV